MTAGRAAHHGRVKLKKENIIQVNAVLTVIIVFLIVFSGAAGAWTVVEDFEPPHEEWRFTSYSGQDQQPNFFDYSDDHAAGGTDYSLKIWGNCWKLEDISDREVYIHRSSIWRISLYTPWKGTLQAFGITDGTNAVIYPLNSSAEPPDGEEWVTAYDGWKDTEDQFKYYKLPVGEDWYDRYGGGDWTQVTGLIFINDEDTDNGIVYFDQILDITEDEPARPVVDAGPDKYAAVGESVYFEASIEDPDSIAFDCFWDFGDGTVSGSMTAEHSFSSPGGYNVLFCATDENGWKDCDSLLVIVGGDDSSRIAKLLFGGDAMFGRRYEDADEDGIPGNNDGSLILPGDDGEGAQAIGHWTRRHSADLKIINLETPLSNQGSPHPTKTYTFRSRPDSVAGLTENGADVVSLANNHIMDYGEQALTQTMDVLADPQAYSEYARDYPISFTGAGNRRYDAAFPVTKAIDGLRIGFVGLCSIDGVSNNHQPFLHAGYDKPGFSQLNLYNLTRSVQKCEQMADLTVVMMHGGYEYEVSPSGTVLELAHEAVNLGADLVIAHHPHVSQGIEIYNGVPIVFSLGNYIFEQKFLRTMKTFMAEVQCSRDGVLNLLTVPVFIEDYVPKFVVGGTGDELIYRIGAFSSEFDTTIIPCRSKGIVSLTGDEFDKTLIPFEESIPLTYRNLIQDYGSTVIELSPGLHLQSIDQLHNVPGSFSVLTGYDRLVFGNMEDDDLDDEVNEGTGWALEPGATQTISQYNPFDGENSLRLRLHESAYYPTEVETDGRMPIIHSELYSICGYARTSDAGSSYVDIYWMYYPYTWDSWDDYRQVCYGPISEFNDWHWFDSYCRAPYDLEYARVQARQYPPDDGSDYGYFYMDNVRLIEWTEHEQPFMPMYFNAPGGIRFIAVKAGSSAADSSVSYTVAEYDAEDYDEDGLYDFLEDADGDGVVDFGESDPMLYDTDGDGLSDGEEFYFGDDGYVTFAYLIDSDGDMFSDYQEWDAGTDPTDDQSFPDWPTPTFTATLSPTPSPTASPTRTPTSTLTPYPTSTLSPTHSPTYTPTLTPTLSPTHTPSLTPTDSPSWSPTSTAAPTDTITPVQTGTPVPLRNGVRLILNDTFFQAGDNFHLHVEIGNDGADVYLDLYVLLEVYGAFWFYPSWLQELDSELHFASYGITPVQILDFIWPDNAGQMNGVIFWSAVFHRGSFDIFGHFDSVEWNFG